MGIPEKGPQVAIKIYPKEKVELEKVEKRIEVMKKLKHQNLIQVIDVRRNAKYQNKDECKYCYAIILEYAEEGELLDYISWTGKFS